MISGAAPEKRSAPEPIIRAQLRTLLLADGRTITVWDGQFIGDRKI
jgi:hypothetical protein